MEQDDDQNVEDTERGQEDTRGLGSRHQMEDDEEEDEGSEENEQDEEMREAENKYGHHGFDEGDQEEMEEIQRRYKENLKAKNKPNPCVL